MSEIHHLNPYEARLIATMLPLSKNVSSWEQAKLEWFVYSVEEGKGSCACGKNPIKYLCFLRNAETQKEVILGSSCAENYLGIYTSLLFKDLAILAGTKLAWLSEQSLAIACNNGYITSWEYNFYQEVQQKYKIGKLSPKQQAMVDKIHRYVGKLIKAKP